MISAQIREVLELQKEYTSKNTPAMQRRGILIRKEIAGSLNENLDRFNSKYEIAIHDLWVQGKDGDGNKAEIPWVRLGSKELSPSAMKGWYVVFLFSATGSNCYLSLGHSSMIYEGDSIEKRYQKPLPPELADEMMKWGREKLRLNEIKVPRLKFKMDLEAKGILAEAYNRTSLCGFEYSKTEIPSDDQIISDVEFLLEMLSKIYLLQETDATIPGSESPEHQDAVAAISQAAGRDLTGPRRQGRSRLPQAHKKVIEEHAVEVAMRLLEKRGFTGIKDVGKNHSYDIAAQMNGIDFYIEVKGTISLGEKVVLTKNEVMLHHQEHPNNALIVVSQIDLDRSEPPSAKGGKVLFISPWRIEESDLEALGYDYKVNGSQLAKE
jgi:hypothetical protein